MNDGTLDSALAVVSITVRPVNDPPVAASTSAAVDEDTPGALTLSATDLDGDALAYVVAVSPAHGTLTGTAPNLTYTPEPNYSGTDSLSFSVSDGTVESNVAVVSITVTPVNDPPSATGGAVSLDEDTSAAVTLTGTDVEGAALTFAVVAPPSHGALSGTAPNLTYTPSADFNGTDSFTYESSDGTTTSAPAQVSITVRPVNDAPVAANASPAADEDSSVAVTLSATDVDGDALAYVVAVAPSHGMLSGTAPNLTYTPAPNYNGSDSLSFTASDGTLGSNVAIVTVTVRPVNDPPSAPTQTLNANAGVPLDVTLSATDLDGDALTYSVVSGPSNGTVTGTAPNLTYTSNAGFAGTDSFTYRANDGSADSNLASIVIQVAAAGSHAPVASDGSSTTAEDTSVAISLAATDADGDTLAYSVVAQPAHGTLSGTGPNLTYAPAANFNGTDTFTFKANDGALDSNVATVTISVSPVNDAPAAEAVAASLDEDATGAVVLAGSDVDGDAITYAIASQPAHGALSGPAPNLTYTPAANYNGADAFTFTVSDGTATSTAQTVTLTIRPVNDAPTGTAQNVTVDAGQAIPITLSATDVDGDALTFTVVGLPIHGQLTGTPPNLTYTADEAYEGGDSFKFRVGDGVTQSAAQQVSITVAAAVQPPGGCGCGQASPGNLVVVAALLAFGALRLRRRPAHHCPQNGAAPHGG